MPNSASSKRSFKPLLFACLFIICTLSVANLVLSNVLSTKGIEFGQKSAKLSNLQSDNRRLNLALSQLASLSNIKKQASDLGFVEINSAITINTATGTFAAKM